MLKKMTRSLAKVRIQVHRKEGRSSEQRNVTVKLLPFNRVNTLAYSI